MPEHSPAPNFYRSIYGFALYLIGQLLFICYLLWTFIPESVFQKLGIVYLPDKYWAIAIPIYLLNVLALFAFVVYPALNLMMTPNLNDVNILNGTPDNLWNDVDSCINRNTGVCSAFPMNSDQQKASGDFRGIEETNNQLSTDLCLSHKGYCYKNDIKPFLDSEFLVPPAQEIDIVCMENFSWLNS